MTGDKKMTENQFKQLVLQGEGVDVEFKESYDSLAKSVFETICAFLNRKGGHILLGISDSREIMGVEPGSIQKHRRRRCI